MTDQERKAQIDNLKNYFEHVKELRNGNVLEVKIPNSTQSGEIKIDVIIDQRFPASPPILQVFPAFPHPLLKDNGYVTNFQYCNDWNRASDLVTMLVILISELQTSPSYTGLQNQQRPIEQLPVQSGHKSQDPIISQKEMDKIYSLTVEELQNLICDENALQIFLDENCDFQSYTAPLRDINNTNIKLSESILAHREEYERSMTELSELKSELTELSSISAEIRKNPVLNLDQRTLIERMDGVANALDQESENISSQFLDNQLASEEFLKVFIPIRQQFHMAKAKVEYLNLKKN